MSYTNQTANYGLPQYEADDKPTYLGDFNKAMLDIDTNMKSIDVKAISAESNASSANATAQSAQSTAETAQSTAESAQATATQAQTTATQAQSTANTAKDTADNTKETLESKISVIETNLENLNSKINNYTTEEKIIGKWIDGKPLYQKTFTINVPSQDLVEFKHNIPNISKAWIDSASFLNMDDSIFLPINYIRYGTDNNIYCHVSNEKISLKVQAVGWVGNDAYVTINYTKTTD